MKDSRIFKIHTFLFFLKRFLLCVLVFFLKGLDSTTKAVIFISIQVLYFAYVVILRCPKLVSDQIIEIFTEFTFIVLIAILLFNNEMNDWSKAEKYIFVSIILFIFVFQAAVSLCKSSLTLMPI